MFLDELRACSIELKFSFQIFCRESKITYSRKIWITAGHGPGFNQAVKSRKQVINWRNLCRKFVGGVLKIEIWALFSEFLLHLTRQNFFFSNNFFLPWITRGWSNKIIPRYIWHSHFLKRKPSHRSNPYCQFLNTKTFGSSASLFEAKTFFQTIVKGVTIFTWIKKY